MGKKGKTGKQRKDNYYKLAKQKGFRSRAAFKLIQLNRKFQFLENSRVCIDLCAAPGGWLQVASEYMPVSSVILGVDLVPITPIRNVITFQADITTKECSETIENNLSNWKADIVLHDGAPNVGRNWLHDAYSQNVLVVHALKIACNHLNKGGWFITKIFRSTDYNSLIWVFGKLFGKVHATKPQASRQESAEIFVVCQNYKKPQQIDPRFFDPSSLFADISNFDDALKKQKADLLKPANKVKKTKAQGYEEGDPLKTISDVQFVASNSHMDYLAQCHQIKLGNSDILSHDSTTDEIKECCKDLKVLGRKDLLRLLKWRRNLRKDLIAKLMKDIKEGTYQDSETGEEVDNLDHLTIKSDDDDVETVPELQLDDFEFQQDEDKRKEARRLKKKEEKRIKDYQQRVNYGMVNHGDVLIEEENDLFSLKTIVGEKGLDNIDDVEPDELVDEQQEPEKEQKLEHKKSVTFSREADVQYFELDGEYGSDEDNDVTIGESVPEKPDEVKIKAPETILKNKNADAAFRRLSKNSNLGGGLLTDLMDINQSKISAASKFFDRETFSGIDLEKEFEMDQVNLIAATRAPKDEEKPESYRKNVVIDYLSRFDDASSTDSDSDDDDYDEKKKQIKLDPQGLALGSMMISSGRVRKDIEDEGWNRFAHGDSHLAPKWFREDEEKHCRRNIPVRQELVNEYKQKLREIDAKPIKKVMEAKARQKRRAMRKMEKVKKKVDAIITNEDMTQRERINQIKTVYKNATKTKKKEVKLVVGRKGLPAKKPTKGKYKMVDKRMKKDMRGSNKKQSKKNLRGKNNRSSNQRSKSRPQKQSSKGKPKKSGSKQRR